jgi:hypothetical protein
MFQLKTIVGLHKAEENKKMGDVMKQEQEIGPVMSIRVSKDERTQDALNKCGTLPSSTHENNINVAAAGQLPANIYGALRQFSFHYSEMVRERSRLAVAAGRVPWRAPIGYVNINSKAGPNIKPDGERAPLIARAFELMATGLHKRSDVLKFVTSEGLTTLTGKPVSPRSFDNILKNPIYAGWIPLSKSRECPPALQPDREAVADFPKIAARVWETKRGSCEREAKKLTSSLGEQKERKNKLFNMRMDNEISREEFEDAKAAVQQRIYETEEKLRALDSNRVTAASFARFAELQLTDMANVWTIASPEQRERVQNLLFEGGLDYSPEQGFLNRSKSSLFHVLEAVNIQETNLVDLIGIEPMTSSMPWKT